MVIFHVWAHLFSFLSIILYGLTCIQMIFGFIWKKYVIFEIEELDTVWGHAVLEYRPNSLWVFIWSDFYFSFDFSGFIFKVRHQTWILKTSLFVMFLFTFSLVCLHSTSVRTNPLRLVCVDLCVAYWSQITLPSSVWRLDLRPWVTRYSSISPQAQVWIHKWTTPISKCRNPWVFYEQCYWCTDAVKLCFTMSLHLTIPLVVCCVYGCITAVPAPLLLWKAWRWEKWHFSLDFKGFLI